MPYLPHWVASIPTEETHWPPPLCKLKDVQNLVYPATVWSRTVLFRAFWTHSVEDWKILDKASRAAKQVSWHKGLGTVLPHWFDERETNNPQ